MSEMKKTAFDRDRYEIVELFRFNVNKDGLTYIVKYGYDKQTGYRFWSINTGRPDPETKRFTFSKKQSGFLWVQKEKKKDGYEIKKEEVVTVLRAFRDKIDELLKKYSSDADIELGFKIQEQPEYSAPKQPEEEIPYDEPF